MSTAALELAVQLNDKASKGMDNIAKKGGGLGSVFSSILNPLGLLTVGIGALGGGLALAAKAAAEEQVGVERLNVALDNSVADYMGRTAAVNAAIAAAEKMAFSDDAARDSLAMLVGVTKSVTGAQEAQAGAMDLARLKGISLEESTAILMGAFNGKTKALEKMGVSLKKGASDTEILAAVQKLAGGQAQAYAGTTAGAMDRLKTSFGNALENIGAVILPRVTEALSGLADFVASDGFQGALTFVAEIVGGALTTAFQAVGDAIAFVTPYLQPIVSAFQQFFGAVQAGGDPLNAFTGLLSNVGTYLSDLGGKVLGAIGEALPGIIAQLGLWGQAFIDWIGPRLPEIMSTVWNLMTLVPRLILEHLPIIIEKLGEWGKAFWEWVSPMIMPMLGALGKLLLDLGVWIVTVALPAIIGKLAEWGWALIKWVVPMIPPLLRKLGELLVQLGTWLLTVALPAIVSKLAEWGLAFLGWIAKDVLPYIGAKLEEFAQAIWAWISQTARDIVARAVAIGTSLIRGVVEGLADAGEQIINFILGLMQGAIDAVKRFFGISSPSKVMAAIGENLGTSLMESWGKSITANVGAVTRALGGVPLAGGGVSSSSMGIPNGAGFSAMPTGGGGGGIGGGITIVVNAGIGADGRRIGQEALEVLSHQLGLQGRNVSHRGI